MTKASRQSNKSSSRAPGRLSETVAAAERALSDAIKFELLVPHEIIGIKSSLKDLANGSAGFIPYKDDEQFEKSWLLYFKRFLDEKRAAVGEVLGCIPESDSDNVPSELPAKGKQLFQQESQRVNEEPFDRVIESNLASNKEVFLEVGEACWSIVMPSYFATCTTMGNKHLEPNVVDAISKVVQDPLKQITDAQKPLTKDMQDIQGLRRYCSGGYSLIFWVEVETKRVFLLSYGAGGGVP